MNINKKDQLNTLSLDTLTQNIVNIKKDIILMKIYKQTKQNIKPHEIKKKQHELAQLLTFKTLKLKS